MAAFGARDLRGLLDVVGAIGYDADGDALSHEVLSELLRLVDAAWVTYNVLPPNPFAGTFVIDRYVSASGAAWTDDSPDVFWQLVGEYPLVAAPRKEVRILWDVTTRRGLSRTAYFNEWARYVDSVTQATIALPDRVEGGWRVVAFDTEVAGRAFGARERAILETVRPYLCRPIEAADAVRRRQRAVGLTARELEMLGAVREGLTNGEIAARFFVAEGTVRKHLEHASAKLGAHTRAEAVALAWR